MQGIACAAKASLSSTRSRSDALMPARASAFRTAGTGPIPITEGSTPATAEEMIRAIGLRPSSLIASPLTTVIAAAPSLIPLDEAAVTVPSATNAGFILASDSRVTPARGCSSVVNDFPAFSLPGNGTGTNSSAKTPAASAFWARAWLSTANASCSARETPYWDATFSAVSPREMVHSFFILGLVNRQPTVLSAIGGGVRFQGAPDLSMTYGARVMFSTPPATNTDPSPARIA